MSGSGPLREMTRNRKVDAALMNERLTRDRVDTLERQATNLHARVKAREQVTAVLSASGIRGFWGRLRWLLTGR